MKRSQSTEPVARALIWALSRPLPLLRAPGEDLFSPTEASDHEAREVLIPLCADHQAPGLLLMPRKGNGAVVCFAHGTGADEPHLYHVLLRAFLDAGIGVLFFKLDGHVGNPRPLRWPDVAHNIPAALDFLRQQPGIDPQRLGVAGVSLGGACALRAAADDPSVRAVATIGAPLRLIIGPAGKLVETIGIFHPQIVSRVHEAPPEHMLGFLTRPIRACVESGSVREMDYLMPATKRTINRLLTSLDPLGAAAALGETPLLVVNGDWDHIAPTEQAQLLHAAASGPKELHLVPQHTHLTTVLHRDAALRTASFFARWLSAREAPVAVFA